jgi:hypothetical protein
MLIEVTSLKLDDHFVPVPKGLSELLTGTWVKDRKKSDVTNEYDRQVIKKNGQLITKLTKK